MSPCELAQKMPSLLADFLDLETSLHRRFREESITDLLLASLVQLADPNLIVFVPKNESKTGNDFDILIVDPASRQAVQYRLQAKRLKPHPTNWMIGSYAELAHPHGTGQQSLSLVRSAAAEKIKTIPLYAFYNPSRTCNAAGGIVSGVELADGRAVRSLVRELIRAKPKRPPLKRIATLQPLFFPLSTILCPHAPYGDSGRRIPSPSGSIRSISAAMDAASERFFGMPGTVPKTLLSDLSQSGHLARSGSVEVRGRFPPLLREALDRRFAETSDRIVPAKVRRPRVVLFSDG
ncbi:MAG TPA: DUF6615 family protein [Allosphingosinicella sp.]